MALVDRWAPVSAIHSVMPVSGVIAQVVQLIQQKLSAQVAVDSRRHFLPCEQLDQWDQLDT